MGERFSKQFRVAPLQKLSVRPIEDPEQQAALDEKLEQRPSAAALPNQGRRAATRKATLSTVEDLYRLSSQLTADERRELVKRLLSDLPSPSPSGPGRGAARRRRRIAKGENNLTIEVDPPGKR